MPIKYLVGAIDQGTSSSRFLVFNPLDESVVSQHQIEFQSHYPQEGWVEHDPWDLLNSVKECVAKVAKELNDKGLLHHLVSIGITNQRETTVVWDGNTGQPLHKAIVWLDTRTQVTVENLLKKLSGDKDALRGKCGLPLSTYFSAVKLRWLLDNVPEVRRAADEKRLCFGTVDSWLIWNLTAKAGAARKDRLHITDVTNASRTMLMDLETLDWDHELLKFFGVEEDYLPKIVSSSQVYGLMCYDGSPCSKVPISGCLGDQQAALVGQHCLNPGMAKNTYGTGCFMLYNVGPAIVSSDHGMLSTVAYKMGQDAKAVYALEGSIAIAGAAVKWLRDNMGIIKNSAEVETLASEVGDTGGVYFVPAFSGLFAPHWRPDARGVICGLTHSTRRQHLCRAALEAVCFQTREIVEAMNKDSGLNLGKLLVDGGMTNNALLMQMQADFLNLSVTRPGNVETTALGAAMAAGRAVGAWDLEQTVDRANDRIFKPSMAAPLRNSKYAMWKKAIEKSLGWEDVTHYKQ